MFSLRIFLVAFLLPHDASALKRHVSLAAGLQAASSNSPVARAFLASAAAGAGSNVNGTSAGSKVNGTRTKRKPRYAFVMMAFDPPGSPPEELWGPLAMASAIRNLSSYPLVLLTNSSRFTDGTEVAAGLKRLGVEVLPVNPVPIPDSLLHERRHMPCQEHNPPVCQYQFLKLQIWRLTQYDKLIWMDSDGILVRNIDSLFEREGTWAQQDNWDCGSNLALLARTSLTLTRLVDRFQRLTGMTPVEQQSIDVCSGMLLLEPSEKTYQELVGYMSGLDSAPGGDQQIVADYFAKVRKSPVRLLDVATASFGQCVGKAIPGGVYPAFVHKSEWTNSCFHLGTPSPECASQWPLGSYWRNHFCHAAAVVGVSKEERVQRFCGNSSAIFQEAETVF